MSLAVALVKYTPEGVPAKAIVKVTMSNTPAGYVSGGDPLNLTPNTWTDPNGKGLIGYPSGPTTSEVPIVQSNTGFTSTAVGSYAEVVPGTTLATYKLQIFTPGGTELAAGNYPSDMLSGSWQIAVPV